MNVLVAVLPPLGLIAFVLGIRALARRPRLVVPVAWVVSLVVAVLIALELALPGPTPEGTRVLAAAPALGFLAVLWLGVFLLRRRRSR